MKSGCTRNGAGASPYPCVICPDDGMERLKCKACGCYGMVPLDLEDDASDLLEEDGAEDLPPPDEQESRFYSCHVCGDNWLSVRVSDGSDTRITFVHQMGMQPMLKRTAHVPMPFLGSDQAVERWDYFVGDDAVGEDEWRELLARRRFVLRSVCTN